MTADDRRGSGGYDTEPRRSIFASLWFRVLLVVILLGVAGVLAVPYVLDVMNPPPPKPMAVGTPASPALPLPAPAPAPESAQNPPVAPGPSAPAPAPAAAPATKEEKQTERPKTTKPEKQPARRTAKASAPSAAAGSGAYWIQVGAFKNADAARRLAARLREQNYPVLESSTSGGADRAPSAPPASGGAVSDKYDVFVVGGSPEDITVKLSAKGLSTEPARDGVVVKPSLPLRDAIALSKDLAAEGLKVQVRRSGGPASAAATPAPGGNAGGEVLYRVRVGPYPDRAAATSAQKEREGKGYRPFIARR